MNIKSIHDKIDKPFKYGENDCVRLIIDFYDSELPKEWEGFTSGNYYKKAKHEQVEILEKFIKDNFKRIDRPKFGCLVTHPKIKGFVGIYMNNNIVVIVTIEQGVKAIPLPKGSIFWEVK